MGKEAVAGSILGSGEGLPKIGGADPQRRSDDKEDSLPRIHGAEGKRKLQIAGGGTLHKTKDMASFTPFPSDSRPNPYAGLNFDTHQYRNAVL